MAKKSVNAHLQQCAGTPKNTQQSIATSPKSTTHLPYTSGGLPNVPPVPLPLLIFERLPGELEGMTFMHLPLLKDAIGLAQLSFETGHNRFARLFIERHADDIIRNHDQTRRFVCKGEAFWGEGKELNKRAVVLMTRVRHQNIDRPGTLARAALGIKTNRRTYAEIRARLLAGDTSGYARPGGNTVFMKRTLGKQRNLEEDSRYFAPGGKAETILNQLSELLDGRTHVCHGCLSDGPTDSNSWTYNLGLLCTSCVDILFGQRLVRWTTLQDHGAHIFSQVTDDGTRTLDDNTKLLTQRIAYALCILQYGITLNVLLWRHKRWETQTAFKDHRSMNSNLIKIVTIFLSQYLEVKATGQVISYDLSAYAVTPEFMQAFARERGVMAFPQTLRWLCRAWRLAKMFALEDELDLKSIDEEQIAKLAAQIWIRDLQELCGKWPVEYTRQT